MSGGKRPTQPPPPAPPKQDDKRRSTESSKSTFYDQHDEAPSPSASGTTFYTSIDEPDAVVPEPPKARQRRSKLLTSPPPDDDGELAKSCPDVNDISLPVVRTDRGNLNVPHTKRLSRSDETLTRENKPKPQLKPKPQPRISRMKGSNPELSKPKSGSSEHLAAVRLKPKPEVKPKAEVKPRLEVKPKVEVKPLKPKPKPKPPILITDSPKSQSVEEDGKPLKSSHSVDRTLSDGANIARSQPQVQQGSRQLALQGLRKAGVPPLPTKPPNSSRLIKKKSQESEESALKEVNNNQRHVPTAPVRRKKTLRESLKIEKEKPDDSAKPAETNGAHSQLRKTTKPPRPPPPKIAPQKPSETPESSPLLIRKKDNSLGRSSRICNSFTTDDLDIGFSTPKASSPSLSGGGSPQLTRKKDVNKREMKKETIEKRKRSRSMGFPFGLLFNKISSQKKTGSNETEEQGVLSLPPEPICIDVDANEARQPSVIEGIDRKTIYPPSQSNTKLKKQENVDEDSIYENINPQIPIYEGIEIKRGKAGRLDLCMSGSQEGEDLDVPIDVDLPVASDESKTAFLQENYYSIIPDDDVEQGPPKPQKVSRKSSRRASRRSSRKHRVKRLNEDNIYETFAEAIAEEDEGKEEEEQLEFSGSDASSFFDSDSFTDDSDMEFEHQQNNRFSETYGTVYADVNPDVPMSKPQRIAMEMLTTEREYVKKLHLIDQVFHTQIMMMNREEHLFPNEVVPMMFSNVKSIYQFHHDFLLPQLEKRMTIWDEEPRIGDVMRKFAPFLKLYTDYVKNFDRSMTTISAWLEKSPKLASFVEEKQRLPECGNLSLQNHMLGPIQRVPRYEMLLKDYLKRLDSDSPDQDDTIKALELVKMAACHSNEAMKNIEKFRKLLEINESLGGFLDLVSPTRELIKEGKLMKISARSGLLMERYIFLFNDTLLVCQTMPTAMIGLKQQYRLKSRLEVDGMQVLEGDNLETPNTFYIKSKQKTIEFHTSSLEEKVEWQVTLWNIIADFTKKQLSRKTMPTAGTMFKECEVGLRAPTWIKDGETSMCMQCSNPFSTFKRRHHCRACGKVVCSKCSTHKAKLAYDEYRENRVCDRCHYVLNVQNGPNAILKFEASTEGTPPSDKSPSTTRRRGPQVLQVQGTDPSVISGYLQMSTDGRNWQKRWFAIHKDFVLYSFKAHQDVVAMTSTPLPGYSVSMGTKKEYLNPDLIFRILHASQKGYYFLVDDVATRNRWVSVLEKVVLAELPSEGAAEKREDPVNENKSNSDPVSQPIKSEIPPTDPIIKPITSEVKPINSVSSEALPTDPISTNQETDVETPPSDLNKPTNKETPDSESTYQNEDIKAPPRHRSKDRKLLESSTDPDPNDPNNDPNDPNDSSEQAENIPDNHEIVLLENKDEQSSEQSVSISGVTRTESVSEP